MPRNVLQGAMPANDEELVESVALIMDFNRMSNFAPAAVLPSPYLEAAVTHGATSMQMNGYAVERLRLEVARQGNAIQCLLRDVLVELRRR